MKVLEVSKFKRGQIWMANLPDDTLKGVQHGRRPIVIISNDTHNHFSASINVVAVTSRQKTELPCHVDIVLNDAHNTILTEQVFTLNKVDILDYMGMLSDYYINKLDNALVSQYGINTTDVFSDYSKLMTAITELVKSTVKETADPSKVSDRVITQILNDISQLTSSESIDDKEAIDEHNRLISEIYSYHSNDVNISEEIGDDKPKTVKRRKGHGYWDTRRLSYVEDRYRLTTSEWVEKYEMGDYRQALKQYNQITCQLRKQGVDVKEIVRLITEDNKENSEIEQI